MINLLFNNDLFLQSLQSCDEQYLDRLEASWNCLISNMELMLSTIEALPSTLRKLTNSFDKSREISDFISTIYTGDYKVIIFNK